MKLHEAMQMAIDAMLDLKYEIKCIVYDYQYAHDSMDKCDVFEYWGA